MKPHRDLVPLSIGELGLIRRALREYITGEQNAISKAAVAARNDKHFAAHAADVKRQSLPRIVAAGKLMDRLLQDPTLSKGENK